MGQWLFFACYSLSGLQATQTFVVVNLGLQKLSIGARGGVIGPYLVVHPNTNFLAGFCDLCNVYFV